MDIFLVESNEGVQLSPLTIHGMLWLQTHFEEAHWNALAESLVKLPIEDAQVLRQDAVEAGLRLNQLNKLQTISSF